VDIRRILLKFASINTKSASACQPLLLDSYTLFLNTTTRLYEIYERWGNRRKISLQVARKK